MTAYRQAGVLLAGALLSAMIAWLLGASGITASADAVLLRLLGQARAPYIYVQAWPQAWLAALAAAGLWLLRPRTARRGRVAGALWACAPCLLAAALWWSAGRWWPPLSTTTAILAVAILRRWRLRRFPELESLGRLRGAAEHALRNGDALPCSLVRLQLRGPGARRLPLSDIVLALKARARRGGDRLARSGGDGFVLWLAHTDADAGLALLCEIRADLAPLLTRHDLRCSMGVATQAEAGGSLEALWQRAAPPGADP